MNTATQKTERYELSCSKKTCMKFRFLHNFLRFSLGQGNCEVMWNIFHVRYEFRNSKYKNISALLRKNRTFQKSQVLLSLTLFPLRVLFVVLCYYNKLNSEYQSVPNVKLLSKSKKHAKEENSKVSLLSMFGNLRRQSEHRTAV